MERDFKFQAYEFHMSHLILRSLDNMALLPRLYKDPREANPATSREHLTINTTKNKIYL